MTRCFRITFWSGKKGEMEERMAECTVDGARLGGINADQFS